MTVTLIKPFKFRRRNGLISVYKKSWLKIGNCLDQGDWIVYFASKSLQPTSSRSSYSKKNFQRLIIIIISKKGSAKREFDIILSGTKSWREVFWKPTRFRRKVKVFRNEVVKSPGRGKRFLEDSERKKGKWNDRLFTELRWYRDRNLEFSRSYSPRCLRDTDTRFSNASHPFLNKDRLFIREHEIRPVGCCKRRKELFIHISCFELRSAGSNSEN